MEQEPTDPKLLRKIISRAIPTEFELLPPEIQDEVIKSGTKSDLKLRKTGLAHKIDYTEIVLLAAACVGFATELVKFFREKKQKDTMPTAPKELPDELQTAIKKIVQEEIDGTG